MSQRWRGEPDATYTYHDYLDGEVVLKTDADGVVVTGTDARKRAAEGLHLTPLPDEPVKAKAKETD